MPSTRTLVLFAAVVATGGMLHAQAPPAKPPAQAPSGPDPLVQQVRTALGHGSTAEARRAIDSSKSSANAAQLAAALVDIFEGKDDDARTKLRALVDARAGVDATLELGLLEMRHGRRSEGQQLLGPIVANRAFNGPEDYFRLARAAVPMGEYLLANDAYQRVKDEPRADIQTEWGDLFEDRDAAGEAVTSYQLALKADKAWVRAYLGLSRAVFEEDPKAAADALEAARKLAPDHPDLWLLTAERRELEDDLPAAKEALDKVAAARPNTVEEFSLRAGIAYIEGKTAEMDAALAKVKAIDPASARGYRAIGEAAALKYRFDDAASFAKKAVELDIVDSKAHADYGLYLMRTGDEKQARVELEQAFKLDGTDTITFNLLGMLDSLEKFEVVENGPFVFKFPQAEAGALGAYALPIAAEAYQTFEKRYGFQPKGPILVEIFAKHDDFAVRTLGIMGLEGALGSCFGRVVSLDSPRARPPGDFSWQATLWHEIAHVFSLQLSDYRVPRWLTEGISVFEEHRKQPAWGRELMLEYAYMLGRNRTFGVKGLPNAFKRIESLALAYFEASLVVEHLVELNGDAGLRTLLKAYSERATDTEAFARAFGRSVDEVETSFKAFVNARYGELARAMADPPSPLDPGNLESVRAMAASAPQNYRVQHALGVALVKAGDLSGARAALERAAQLAPQAQGDDSPHSLLAAIAEKDGDPTRKRRELRALLLYDHTNVAAARELAQLAKAAKATDDEDYALRLVADLDPFDGQTHGLLGRRLYEKGEYASALIEFQAAVAVGPPNLAEAHADVAETALKLNRKDEAKRAALMALKQAPTYARAQDLLLAAIGRE